MIPGFVTEIARFGIITKLGLYDTLMAPLIIYAGTDIMQLYIYKQFIDKIPRALDESARIDGCSYFTIYWKIIFPVILPATATLGILKAITIFNDMYIPYLYMPTKKTVTTMLMQFAGRGGDWASLSAAVIITMVPSLLIFIFLKKYIFDGIVAGAVKE
jgi:multiple sugar transport system permease protein